MMFLSALVSIISFLSINAAAAEPSTSGYYGNDTNTACTFPFYLVGDNCLLISNDFRGTWSQMRDLCLSFDGDLVSFSDANLLYDVNNYIIAHGMNNTNFWVGATDIDIEGTWIWSLEGTEVRPTSAVWGHVYAEQPDGGIDENCACISNREYYFMHDDYCDTSMNGLICQAKQNVALKTTNPVSNECPPPYVKMDSGCFQVDLFSDCTYHEAIELCSGPHSHLAKMVDANAITDIHQYLIGKNAHLWIDGSDELEEGNWIHSDGTQVKMGTPFWYVRDEGQTQDPRLDNYCYSCMNTNAGISAFHFMDFACDDKRGVLCEYDM